MLKAGFRFPGGEERDEAAGLRLRAGNGPVRLHAAHQSESASALVMARCVPGACRARCCPGPGRTWS